MTSRAKAVYWIRQSDWPEWKRICPDFAEDYKAWEQTARAELSKFRERGLSVDVTVVRPRYFVEWCMAKQQVRDRRSLVRYAGMVMGGPPG